MAEPTWRTELTDRSVRDELDRLHPERIRLRPGDLTGIRDAMDLVEHIWAPTFDRARRLPPARLHERVGGEYSFVETVRHLLFVSDAWLRRTVLGDPGPFHEWGVPPNLPADAPPDTGPELDEVLQVRDVRNDLDPRPPRFLDRERPPHPCRWTMGSAEPAGRTPCPGDRLLPRDVPRGVVAPPVRNA